MFSVMLFLFFLLFHHHISVDVCMFWCYCFAVGCYRCHYPALLLPNLALYSYLPFLLSASTSCPLWSPRLTQTIIKKTNKKKKHRLCDRSSSWVSSPAECICRSVRLKNTIKTIKISSFAALHLSSSGKSCSSFSSKQIYGCPALENFHSGPSIEPWKLEFPSLLSSTLKPAVILTVMRKRLMCSSCILWPALCSAIFLCQLPPSVRPPSMSFWHTLAVSTRIANGRAFCRRTWSDLCPGLFWSSPVWLLFRA